MRSGRMTRAAAACSLYALTFLVAILIYPLIVGEIRGDALKILLFGLIAFLSILMSALITLFAPLIALKGAGAARRGDIGNRGG
ncbi:MAG: hypothetical protein QW692_00845 [Nitrososphaerota archaeon]